MTVVPRRVLLILFVAMLPFVTLKLRGADEIEYFSYLRSLVFDGDLDFENEYRHFVDRDPQGLAGFRETFLDNREPLTGRPKNFAPIGSALLWSPAYLLAHAGVLAARGMGSGVAADGFSLPYVAAVCYASAFYAFLGLWLAERAVRVHGGAAGTAAVAALWWGTPLLYYMTIAPGFSHGTSVLVVTLTLWLWLRTVETGGRVVDWAAIGAAGGVSGLVREQDILYLAAPALWLFVRAFRTGAWGAAIVRAAALVAAAVAAFLPQLLAYRALNGGLAPSRNVQNKMIFTSPHFFEVLFDPGHGLFVWSPLVLVAVLGLLAAWQKHRDAVRGALLLAFLLQVWINGSVDSWTQAGAFGSRRFVSATPILAFGLAFVFDFLRRRAGAWAAPAAIALAVWWNVSLMVQFGLRLMDRQRLEWPKVAINQVREVPARLGRTVALFLTDREQLVREAR